jgi:hypothetical protein
VELIGVTVTDNAALGGAGATPGQGVGGGIYIASGTVCIDPSSLITGNFASTSNNDIFGTFLTNC